MCSAVSVTWPSPSSASFGCKDGADGVIILKRSKISVKLTKLLKDQMSDFIEYHGSKLFYYKYGVGQKAILLFHGFGQDHTAFNSWIEVLKGDYMVYSFDLFFHGDSVWTSSDPVEKADWKEIIELFLRKEKIVEFELSDCSMGGKFVLSPLESFPDRIKKIALIAPDGIKVNFWYRLATYPFLMRALFESFVS